MNAREIEIQRLEVQRNEAESKRDFYNGRAKKYGGLALGMLGWGLLSYSASILASTSNPPFHEVAPILSLPGLLILGWAIGSFAPVVAGPIFGVVWNVNRKRRAQMITQIASLNAQLRQLR